jgi:GWxTD domain-containing protein
MYISLFCLLFTSIFSQTTKQKPKTLSELFDIKSERPLFVKAELLRFLDNDGNTEFHINYKIPNSELHFLKENENFIARLEIFIELYQGEQLIDKNKYTHLAGATSITIAQSENHYVLDKISATIAEPDYELIIAIHDRNASTLYTQTFKLELLDKNSLISDIEISHGISKEPVPALQEFNRGGIYFYVDPIPVIVAGEREFVLYYEAQNISVDDNGFSEIIDKFTIYKEGEIIISQESKAKKEGTAYKLIHQIPLEKLNAGFYEIEAIVTDVNKGNYQSRKRSFSITKKYTFLTQRVFPLDDDEYQLISYFLDNRQKRTYRGLNDEGKKVFIERFWAANNPNPVSKDNEFLEKIKNRVNEANWRFAHHRAGWTTDMGRIYVKYGTPSEIDKGETDSNVSVRYANRPYQIWKYNGIDKAYLFLDMMGNGTMRLIYSKNDDEETTDPNWKSYFGYEFDFSSLDL